MRKRQVWGISLVPKTIEALYHKEVDRRVSDSEDRKKESYESTEGFSVPRAYTTTLSGLRLLFTDVNALRVIFALTHYSNDLP